MPRKARAFIFGTILFAIAVSITAVVTSEISDRFGFSMLLLLAALAGTVKVRLPGIQGTYSLHFVCVLLSIQGLSLVEVVGVAAAGAFTQSVWRAKTPPSALQIIFNMAAVALAGAASYGAYTAVMSTGPLNYEISAGAFAAAVYWTLNTGLVSCVLTLLNDGSFWDLWATWSIWSLPYYLTSAALTIPIGNWAYRGQWRPAFLLASAIVLVTIWFRVWVQRDAPAR